MSQHAADGAAAKALLDGTGHVIVPQVVQSDTRRSLFDLFGNRCLTRRHEPIERSRSCSVPTFASWHREHEARHETSGETRARIEVKTMVAESGFAVGSSQVRKVSRLIAGRRDVLAPLEPVPESLLSARWGVSATQPYSNWFAVVVFVGCVFQRAAIGNARTSSPSREPRLPALRITAATS